MLYLTVALPFAPLCEVITPLEISHLKPTEDKGLDGVSCPSACASLGSPFQPTMRCSLFAHLHPSIQPQAPFLSSSSGEVSPSPSSSLPNLHCAEIRIWFQGLIKSEPKQQIYSEVIYSNPCYLPDWNKCISDKDAQGYKSLYLARAHLD